MSGAAFAILANTLVTALFAVTFFALAWLNPSFGRVRWFGISYAAGIMTPFSEFLIPRVPFPDIFITTSYASFVAAFALMAAALAKFYGRQPRWLVLGLLTAAAIATRFAIWGGARNTFPYELFYQLPFALMMLVCAATVYLVSPRRFIDNALSATYVVVAAHFLLKPFLAVMLGSGAAATAYIDSRYALFSQASTGLLLVAVGLLLVVIVVREMLIETALSANIDGLSGLPNRYSFDLQAEDALSRARQAGTSVAFLMFDIDHFKKINDTFGHSAGDEAIRAVGGLFRRLLPDGAIVGRLGGEEFAVMLEGANAATARLFAEQVRAGLRDIRIDQAPGRVVTFSVGIASAADRGSKLAELMLAADRALYDAKQAGRDRVCMAASALGAVLGSNDNVSRKHTVH